MLCLFIESPAYFLRFSGIVLCLILGACSTLPPQSTPTPSYHPTEWAKTSTLAQRLAPLRQQYPNLTGYHVLTNPEDALGARLTLIAQAEKTIDIQYYIWENDAVGAWVFHALLESARRGVKVRIFVDDNNAQAIEGILLALSQHQNIEVKLFNPYRFRKYRAVDMLLDTKRINRRMHNKSLIVDGELSIIGGRNIGNQYFNVSQEFQFADIDVLLAGQGNDEVQQAFDEYWNHAYAYPIQQIVNPRHHGLRYDEVKRQLQQHYANVYHPDNTEYQVIHQHLQAFQRWFKEDLNLEWVPARIFADPPTKVNNTASTDEYVLPEVLTTVAKPTKQLDIISAYFIPTAVGVEHFQQLEQAGVNVRIITNSLASTDVSGVHAYYRRYRPQMLKDGVELYEFLPVVSVDEFMLDSQHQFPVTALWRNTTNVIDNVDYAPIETPQPTLNLINPATAYVDVNAKHRPPARSSGSGAGSSYASLHAKTFILDHRHVFIGSMNLDPRSVYYNTEIGVLLDSPVLANQLHETLNHTLDLYAWHLVLNAQQRIRWTRPAIEHSPAVEKKREPNTSRFKRVTNKLLSWLPLERYF